MNFRAEKPGLINNMYICKYMAISQRFDHPEQKNKECSAGQKLDFSDWNFQMLFLFNLGFISRIKELYI